LLRYHLFFSFSSPAGIRGSEGGKGGGKKKEPFNDQEHQKGGGGKKERASSPTGTTRKGGEKDKRSSVIWFKKRKMVDFVRLALPQDRSKRREGEGRRILHIGKGKALGNEFISLFPLLAQDERKKGALAMDDGKKKGKEGHDGDYFFRAATGGFAILLGDGGEGEKEDQDLSSRKKRGGGRDPPLKRVGSFVLDRGRGRRGGGSGRRRRPTSKRKRESVAA